VNDEQLRVATAPAGNETMGAIVQTAYGLPQEVLRFDQVERPVPGADDVLVQVRATSVNTPDLVAVTGEPSVLRVRTGIRRPSVAVRGSDVAGVVVAVGDEVTDLRPGDEVFGSVWNGRAVQASGTFAEFAVAPANQVIIKPATLTFVEAAASVMAGVTALIAIRDVAAARPGQRVLINGASGGVGTFSVQIAAALGAEVTGVCSTRNVELVRSLGAEHVIDHTQGDFTLADQCYDVLLDNVMNHPPAATVGVLAPGGVFIPNSIGTSGGVLAGLPRMARAALMGLRPSVDVRTVTYQVDRTNLAELARRLERGDVTAVIDRTYPLRDAATAVSHVLGHHARGKVALLPSTPTDRDHR
jgi:NADPH:quinone reductase-like Zn-dependent oxidoreductase